MAGKGTPDWIRGSDQEVRDRLQETKQRFSAAAPYEVLGIAADADEKVIRAAFLSCTKIFHPARFARRPEDVRELSNEVFLLMKEAHDDITSAPAKANAEQAPMRPKAKGTGQRSSAVLVSPKSTTPSSGTAPPRATTASDANRTPRPSGKGTMPGRVSAATRRRLMAQKRAETNNPELAAARRKSPPSNLKDVVKAVKDRSGPDEAERFAEAKKLLAGKDFKGAADAFRRLAAGNPDERQYRAYLHYTWASEARIAGDLEKARAEYNRALQKYPDFTRAKQDLERVTPQPKKRKSGLFNKLFGDDN
jgi:tetratricopeptide (TPR) repeat protein